MAESLREDVLGCVERLRDALSDPALDHFDQAAQAPGTEACQAACRLAVALGYCRLFGIRPPEDLDGTLPSTEATAAAGEICRQIEQWTDDARKLGSRWDAADPLEAESLCADLLEGRMDAWAGVVAIGEAYHACLVDREPKHEVLGEAFRRLVTDIQAFDAVLQEEETLAILSTLVGTQLLDNWRALLVEPFVLAIPWWLDGTLEKVDRRIEAECLATIPGPDAWRRLRNRLATRSSSRVAGWRHSPKSILAIGYQFALAGDKEEGEPPLSAPLKWASPDGRFQAMLSCPTRLPRGEKLPLTFHRIDYEPATELGDEPVWLAGVAGRIGTQARAEFELEPLQRALGPEAGELKLEVFERREEWLAVLPGAGDSEGVCDDS